MNINKAIKIFVLSLLLILNLASFSWGTLYYNDYFDNTSYQDTFKTTKNLGSVVYGITTVKLINDPTKDDPPTAFGVDAGMDRIVWQYHNVSTNAWYIYAYYGYTDTYPGFSNPRGITVNSDGDVYVSDRRNNSIVKLRYNIDVPAMIFIKHFGNDRLNLPEQVALDKQGNVYVCDSGNNRIVVFNSNGDFLRSFGTTGSGVGQFQNPMGVTVSIVDGSIYVADTGNGRIQKFDSAGNFIKEFRRSDEQPITATYFSLDSDIFGNVYAVDSMNNLVYKFTPDLEFVMSTSGKPDSPFQNLHGISTDKSYDSNGVWFSSGNAFTVENTRGQYFDIGMDVVEVGIKGDSPSEEGTVPFYPRATQNNTIGVLYRLTENGEVTINVKDETGTSIIRRLVSNALEGTGNQSHTWDGRDDNGKLVAEGKYSFEIIAHDLYNEGNGNRQVIKLTDNFEIVLPPKVSNLTVSPTTVRMNETLKVDYSISKAGSVSIKAYRSDSVFTDETLARTVINNVSKQTGNNSDIWDIKDETTTKYVGDGIYTVEITASDYAGTSEPERSPPIRVDMTPSYVTNIYCEPMIFKPNEGIPTTLNYTLSDKADIKIDIVNIVGEILRTDSITIPQSGVYTYQWDGKINGSLVADGSYVLKITSFDDVGNKAEASASCIKNRIPVSITYPTTDLARVADTVIITGTAVDPNMNNGEDFDNYKLYYCVGHYVISNPTQIPEVENNIIWRPIPVPASNQLSTDPLYPISNISYRSVINTTLGEWDTTTLTDGTYTILLISKDKAGNVQGATRVVEVKNAGASVNVPNITITPFDSSFSPNGNNYMVIVYALSNKESNVTMEIYNLGQNNGDSPQGTVPIILHREYLKTQIGEHAVVWDGRNYLDKIVESGNYRIKFTARATDGVGVKEASKDISITAYLPPLSITLSATPSVFKPGEQITTINYGLNKPAKVSVGIYADAVSSDLLKTFVSNETKETGQYNISWNGTDLASGAYVVKVIAHALDVL